jgi:hypothetical protein
MALDHSCQVQRHALAERGDDAYMTPPCATEALLRHVKLPYRLWEPACGDGTSILDVLRAHGHRVGPRRLWAPDCFWRRDFLMKSKAPDGCEAIVTNPPYKLAEPFIEHALDLCPRVIMLLRLAFLESKRRTHILEQAVQRQPGICAEQLREIVWQSNPDGGPEDRKAPHVHVFQLNQRLAPYGVVVRAQNGAGAGYRVRLLNARSRGPPLQKEIPAEVGPRRA